MAKNIGKITTWRPRVDAVPVLIRIPPELAVFELELAVGKAKGTN